jgi:hypothetical protein
MARLSPTHHSSSVFAKDVKRPEATSPLAIKPSQPLSLRRT